MKYLLITLLLLSTLYSQEKEKVTLGLGSYIQTQPYAHVDTITIPSPVVFFDNGFFLGLAGMLSITVVGVLTTDVVDVVDFFDGTKETSFS